MAELRCPALPQRGWPFSAGNDNTLPEQVAAPKGQTVSGPFRRVLDVPLEDLGKVISSAGSAVAVGEVRRPSSPATDVVVEVQGPRPFGNGGSLADPRHRPKRYRDARRWGKPARLGRTYL